MVLALGSQFADLEQDDNVPTSDPLPNPAISSMDISKIKIPSPARNPGWRFYQVSRRLLSDVVSSCSMTSIQACALQGTFLITTSAHDIAYNVWGLAVRMSVNMGLHRAVGGDVLHPHVRELRNRLWWSIYTLDRLFGFWMGRPTMFDDNEIDAPFPQDLPELKLEQPTGSVDGQIALIKLCRIMDRIVKRIYPNTATPVNGQVINMGFFVELQDALEQWKSELPEPLRPRPTSTRGAVHLHLTHQHAVMLLTRTSLSHAAATKGSRTYPKHRYKIKFLHDAARACIFAAKSTIELLKGLRDRGLLCRYSCQDPLFCTAALCVLLLGAKLEPPGPEMKKIITDGILILQLLGEGSETAASSLGGILRGFQPFFQTVNKEPQSLPEPARHGDRVQGRKAWESWLNQSAKLGSPSLAKQADTPYPPVDTACSLNEPDLSIGLWAVSIITHSSMIFREV